MLRESTIEEHLHARIKALGGETRRVKWIGRQHAPDDYVMLPRCRSVPSGFIGWVECKAPTKGPRPGQQREHDRMRCLGVSVLVLSSHDEVDDVFPHVL